MALFLGGLHCNVYSSDWYVERICVHEVVTNGATQSSNSWSRALVTRAYYLDEFFFVPHLCVLAGRGATPSLFGFPKMTFITMVFNASFVGNKIVFIDFVAIAAVVAVINIHHLSCLYSTFPITFLFRK